jgi:hypothetical protein
MVEFADSVADSRLRRSLQAALGRSRPFHRFKDALADDPREREGWFACQAERLREAMRRWLADNDIEPTPAPPRRSGEAAPAGRAMTTLATIRSLSATPEGRPGASRATDSTPRCRASLCTTSASGRGAETGRWASTTRTWLLFSRGPLTYHGTRSWGC